MSGVTKSARSVSACGENCARSLCSAFPHATRFAGLARGPQIVLDKKKTGRTRKGYAASVSGKAANGCAVDSPKEKNAGAELAHACKLA